MDEWDGVGEADKQTLGVEVEDKDWVGEEETLKEERGEAEEEIELLELFVTDKVLMDPVGGGDIECVKVHVNDKLSVNVSNGESVLLACVGRAVVDSKVGVGEWLEVTQTEVERRIVVEAVKENRVESEKDGDGEVDNELVEERLFFFGLIGFVKSVAEGVLDKE